MDEVHGQVVTLRAVGGAGALVADLEKALKDLGEAVSKSTTAVIGLQREHLVARVRFQGEVSQLSLERKAP